MQGKFNSLFETLRFDNRWQLLVDQLLSGRALRLYRLGGVDAIADHRTGDHLGGIRGVLGSNEYRCLLHNIPLKDVSTVVDLGAHVGGFILLLKTLGTSPRKILCVEPNPASRVKLRFNLDHNGIHADIFEGAVAGISGVRELHIGKCSTGFSLLPDHPDTENGVIEVETATLDALLDQHLPQTVIDICKMDVEGAEFEILQGEHARSIERCKFLICEIHASPRHKPSDLLDAISAKGFEIVPVTGSVHPETMLFRNHHA